MPAKLSRTAYAQMFGPTTGDRLRLADTDLIIEVERDFTIYGEEVKFGGGKVIRDGMGQSQLARSEGAVDTVITRIKKTKGTVINSHSVTCCLSMRGCCPAFMPLSQTWFCPPMRFSRTWVGISAQYKPNLRARGKANSIANGDMIHVTAVVKNSDDVI